jgi:uncharacterized OB-fold protein
MMRLQRCAECAHAQYPPREFCGTCLSDRLAWHAADSLHARVVARTVLRHSNEPRFRPRLPLTLGLVQFDNGPIAVCFLSPGAAAGDMVRIMLDADGLLTGTGDDDGGA